MTRKEFFFAFMGLFLTLSGVNAGNAWFEPLTRFSSSDISSQRTVAANGTNRDPFSRGVGRAPEKRWVTIMPKTNGVSNLWPDKTIKFCFDSVESRGLFYENIIKGMDLWHQAGLDSSFKMTEVSDKDCFDQSKRSEILFISQGKGLSTSVGFSDDNTMMLSNSADMGMLNVLSNVAHEIGHAWGLYHEHQNIYFWDAPYVFGSSGKLFGASNFHCKNLKDYDAVMEKIQKEIDESSSESVADTLEGYKEEICEKRYIAQKYKFSATEYLPLLSVNPNPGTTDPSKIDWDSIMLYPSGAGGTDLGNGERRPILTRPNGDEIGLNLVPSQRDVAGLTALYGADDETDKPLLNDNKSGMRKVFDKVRNTDTGACN